LVRALAELGSSGHFGSDLGDFAECPETAEARPTSAALQELPLVEITGLEPLPTIWPEQSQVL